jgi:hypothetical protein
MHPLKLLISEQEQWKNSHGVTLYEEAKHYPIQGTDFSYGVFSITDEEENFPVSVDDPDKINIALYHGQVDSSRSSAGYLLESKTKIDMFSEYDFGFFGDIHKPQGFVLTEHVIEEEIDENEFEKYKLLYPDIETVQ